MGKGREEWELLLRHGDWIWNDKEVLETGSGNVCTTMWIYLIYLMPLNWTSKNGWNVKFILCVFYQNQQENGGTCFFSLSEGTCHPVHRIPQTNLHSCFFSRPPQFPSPGSIPGISFFTWAGSISPIGVEESILRGIYLFNIIRWFELLTTLQEYFTNITSFPDQYSKTYLFEWKLW